MPRPLSPVNRYAWDRSCRGRGLSFSTPPSPRVGDLPAHFFAFTILKLPTLYGRRHLHKILAVKQIPCVGSILDRWERRWLMWPALSLGEVSFRYWHCLAHVPSAPCNNSYQSTPKLTHVTELLLLARDGLSVFYSAMDGEVVVTSSRIRPTRQSIRRTVQNAGQVLHRHVEPRKGEMPAATSARWANLNLDSHLVPTL
jgi:hypothetical protein